MDMEAFIKPKYPKINDTLEKQGKKNTGCLIVKNAK